MSAKLPVAVRFQRYVPQAPADQCWNWQGHIHPSGYGRFRDVGKATTAHRVAYALAHGSIPHGMLIMHSCDNRRCVNPAHLSLGTYADNNHDMMAKGRFRSDTSAARRAVLGRTSCRRGHEYNAENTNVAGIRRVCKACKRVTAAARKRLRLLETPDQDRIETAIAEAKARLKGGAK